MTIKMQCRDKDGNLLAYNNSVSDIQAAAIIAEQWQEMYKKYCHVVSINIFQ